MIYKTEERSFYIHPGVNCICRLSVPDLSADPDQARAMGNSLSEKSESIDQFLSEIFFPQYVRALRTAVLAYLASDLPEYFLRGHRVLVGSIPIWEDSRAAYDPYDDLVIIDANALNLGAYGSSSQFIYGHELGHRIMHFRGTESTDKAIAFASSVLSTCDRTFLLEVMADAFGALISPGKNSRFTDGLDPIKQEGLQLAALRLAWSC